MHSEWSKLPRVLAVLSAIGLIYQQFECSRDARVKVRSFNFIVQYSSTKGHNSIKSYYETFPFTYFFGYKMVFFPFQNNPKYLDLSYKTDLDIWDCFRRENQSQSRTS